MEALEGKKERSAAPIDHHHLALVPRQVHGCRQARRTSADNNCFIAAFHACETYRVSAGQRKRYGQVRQIGLHRAKLTFQALDVGNKGEATSQKYRLTRTRHRTPGGNPLA